VRGLCAGWPRPRPELDQCAGEEGAAGTKQPASARVREMLEVGLVCDGRVQLVLQAAIMLRDEDIALRMKKATGRNI